MTASADGVATETLSLPEELILILLNEEDGYFHQVPGWNLNCVVVGAALAELSLLGRIDTDLESLILVDKTDTDDITLDTLLDEIASETEQRSTTYWIERLAPLAETIIDDTLARLVNMGILQHHDGDFWTMARTSRGVQFGGGEWRDTAAEFVKNRIIRVIFSDEIPEPRDIILICLVNTCDVFRFIFPIEEEEEERITQISRMDIIGRSIVEAVSQNLAGPLLRRSGLAKKIPTVPPAKTGVQQAREKREHSGVVRRAGRDIWPRVSDQAPIRKAPGIPGRVCHKQVGASAGAHVSAGQGLLP